MAQLRKNWFGIGALLILLAASIAFCLFVFNRARNEARHSNEDEANGRAVSEALGFNYTGLYDEIGNTYVDKGTGILRVEPNGPFDKAGLKTDDCVPLNLKTVKTLLIQQAGKTIVLPVQRVGQRRFNVTVTVPRFTVPYPERVPLAPVSLMP